MKGMELALLAAGGAAGAILRYKISASPLLLGALPVNVLVANAAGSFILGLFVVASQHWGLDGRYALLVAFGFAGSLTTMSAFALETSTMIGGSQYGLAAANILANVGISLGAIAGGRALMGAIAGP